MKTSGFRLRKPCGLGQEKPCGFSRTAGKHREALAGDE
jgi:hypothetical protein